MSNYTREQIQESLAKVFKLFESESRGVDRKLLTLRLRQMIQDYNDYRAKSDDAWMSNSQLSRAMRSIQADLRRAKETLNSPMVLRHLNRNHPLSHNNRSIEQDLSDALSAVGQALANLDEDYSSVPSVHPERQRRTRTSTRDQFLIPRFTILITKYWKLDVDDPINMDEAEGLVRRMLQEWPILADNPAAERYHKISKKPLRRLIRAAAIPRPTGGEK